MPNTVRLHRVLATKPDKVYRAFIEADTMAKWLPHCAPLEVQAAMRPKADVHLLGYAMTDRGPQSCTVRAPCRRTCRPMRI
jgi:uncharacterized protein YndB with AHSA1/START domain